MLYMINIMQAGANQRGSTISSGISYLYFKNKIDFKTIRKILKEIVMSAIESNSPCLNELEIFYNVQVIKDDKVIYYKNNKIKSTNILKWHN